MPLGNPLLPDPQDGFTEQNGASCTPHRRLVFNGTTQGRVSRAPLEEIEPLTVHTYSLKVISTDGADGFVLQVGGTSTGLIEGSDAPGTYPGTVTSAAEPTQLIRLTGDGVTAECELQVWTGTE